MTIKQLFYNTNKLLEKIFKDNNIDIKDVKTNENIKNKIEELVNNIENRISKYNDTKDIKTNEWVYGGYYKHLKRTPSPIGSNIKDEKGIDYISSFVSDNRLRNSAIYNAGFARL